jgi:L-alanine-DL-glutamate epimerase-like enolase superfamily enzyme
MNTLEHTAPPVQAAGSVSELLVSAYTIPTDKPESDGTLEWNETTMVLVRVRCGSEEGIGYTYGDVAIVEVVNSLLSRLVVGHDPMDIPGIHTACVRKIRNNGQSGLAMMAVSAVDIALWDLKAKLLDVPLCRLLGRERESMPIYGSGGFTSYTDEELREQLSGWVRQGIKAVKIKVGRNPEADERRVAVSREAIGEKTGLYVDANAAYTVSEALTQAQLFAGYNVDWLEEPVPAEARRQLHVIREQLSGGMRIAAGEYGYTLTDFRNLLEADAVDVLQADATRCGGITGFLKAGHLCEAFRIPLSSHCAPSVHLHPALSLACFSIAEYFHDHVRIERALFEGVGELRNGAMVPDVTRPGLGLVFKDREAQQYRVA